VATIDVIGQGVGRLGRVVAQVAGQSLVYLVVLYWTKNKTLKSRFMSLLPIYC
jgi:hypothetical protein